MQLKINKLLQQVSLEFLATFLFFIACLLLFAYIAAENVVQNNGAFDTRVSTYIIAHSSPLLIKVMLIVTFFGSTQFLVPTYLVLIAFLLLKNQRLYAVNIAIIAITSTAVMFLLKQIFKRQRPLSPIGETLASYSFPSGHSVSSFIFCCILAYLIWKLPITQTMKYIAAFLLLLLTILIGISRIVLNVHYATDVIAGFCLAIVWVVSSFWIMKKIRKKVLAK